MEASIALPGSVMAVAGTPRGEGSVVAGGRLLRAGEFEWRVPVSGTVYGVILNDRPTWEAWGPAMAQAPYQAPPRAPVLFVKPRNTHAASGARVPMPAGTAALDIGAQLGILFARTATRVSEAEALDTVAGYVPVIDLSIPHATIHRPAIREKCFDGACPIGPGVVPRAQAGDPAVLLLRTRVDGALVAERRLDDLLRPVARLVAEVSAFMSLLPGDLLLAGAPLA
ncbi:MAG: fumarylacetoacetate hydrolase family protein, partial [Rhodocyclaceae bacterium]|nr:fumarylacetoacetate hydrolase family protein [Rhodocyclaceae bacterium]